MKKKLLKFTAILFIFMQILLMEGCSRQKTESVNDTSLSTVTYLMEKFAMPELKGEFDTFFAQHGKLYALTYEWTEQSEENVDEEGFCVSRMYSMDVDGRNQEEIILPFVSTDAWMVQMASNEDGTYTYIYNIQDEQGETSTYVLMKADENGKEIYKEDIMKLAGLENTITVKKLLVDSMGNILIAYDHGLICVSEDMKLKFLLKSDENTILTGLARTRNGKMVAGYSNHKGDGIYLVNVNDQKWEKSYYLDGRFAGDDSLMDGVGDYDIYYKDNSGICGYQISDQSSSRVMDYLASNLDSQNLYSVVALSDGRFLGNVWNGEENEMVLFNKVDPEAVKEKEELSVAMIGMNEDIRNAAAIFNKNNSMYQITIRDYSNETDPLTKLNADMIAGNVADIIVLDNLLIESFVSKGMLEDLDPYIEKDKELEKDDFVASLFNAMEIDGRHYYIAPSFYIGTLAGSKKVFGEQMGWTLDEFLKRMDESNGEIRPFYAQSKTDILYSLSCCATTDFVNWNTGECTYDSQEFKKLLQICNSGTGTEQENIQNQDDQSVLYRDGSVLLSECVGVSYDSMQILKRLYDDDITFIGYPNAERKGSYFTTNTNLGIYAKSKNKEGAWEFVRMFITSDYQCRKVSDGGILGSPTRNDALEFSNQIATATETFRDKYGIEHEPHEMGCIIGDLSIYTQPATQDEVDAYRMLIDHTTTMEEWNQDILDIICEEGKTYFSGDKTVDEVAELIQNRIQIYVKEHR